MADKTLSQLEMITAWLDYVISNEKELLDKFTKSNRHKLRDSFEKAIQSDNPDKVIYVTLRFNRYLRYLDMGVGRGVPIGSKKNKTDFYLFRNSKGQLHKYKRKKIPVYNKPITRQLKKLTELLTDHYGIQTMAAIENMTERSGKIDIKL